MRGMRSRVIAAVGSAAVAILLAADLTGCAALGSALAPGGALLPIASILGSSPSPSASTSTPPTPTPTPTLQHYSDGSRSERGNIPKVVGEKAGVLSADGRTRLVTFTVTRIVTDPHCLNSGAPAPTNGHYVEVDLDVVTTADLGIDGGDTTVTFAPDNWFFYPPDGNGVIAGGIGAVGADDECLLSVASLPSSIGPSQTVSGSVLLDVAPGSVFLAYAPGNGCGCGNAWEWPYSSK